MCGRAWHGPSAAPAGRWRRWWLAGACPRATKPSWRSHTSRSARAPTTSRASTGAQPPSAPRACCPTGHAARPSARRGLGLPALPKAGWGAEGPLGALGRPIHPPALAATGPTEQPPASSGALGCIPRRPDGAVAPIARAKSGASRPQHLVGSRRPGASPPTAEPTLLWKSRVQNPTLQKIGIDLHWPVPGPCANPRPPRGRHRCCACGGPCGKFHARRRQRIPEQGLMHCPHRRHCCTQSTPSSCAGVLPLPRPAVTPGDFSWPGAGAEPSPPRPPSPLPTGEKLQAPLCHSRTRAIRTAAARSAAGRLACRGPAGETQRRRSSVQSRRLCPRLFHRLALPLLRTQSSPSTCVGEARLLRPAVTV